MEQGGSPGVLAEHSPLFHPILPCRLLWYPQGGHALAGVEMEADVFKNCAHWLLQHVGLP